MESNLEKLDRILHIITGFSDIMKATRQSVDEIISYKRQQLEMVRGIPNARLASDIYEGTK